MANNIVPFQFQSNTIREDGLVSITLLSSAYFKATGKRKDTAKWLATSEAIESITYLERVTGVTEANLVVIEHGVGTWVHPDLADGFKKWMGKPSRKKSTYLYVIGDKPRCVCKIGITGDPDKRLRTIQTSYPWSLDFWHCIRVENAASVEKLIHNKFADFRLNGEWFDSQVMQLINWNDFI